ncbi:MAG: hypothetical protein VW986_01770, partial [Gammaproteobacteria bacterium]
MNIINKVVSKLVGSRNQRLIKQYSKTVNLINALEKDNQALSDSDLTNKTQEFKNRLSNGESLADILHEALAVNREAITRNMGLIH